jgi:hypothetical protein
LPRNTDRLQVQARACPGTLGLYRAISNNIKKFFHILQKVLLSAGIAVRNAACVAGKRWKKRTSQSEKTECCSSAIVKPEKIGSDETKVTSNTSQGSHCRKKKEQGIVKQKGPMDLGQNITNRSSAKVSMASGNLNYTGLSNVPQLIFFPLSSIAG